MPDEMTRAKATAWFDRLYSGADRNPAAVPWASLSPCGEVVEAAGRGSGRAIVVGCGLGDDAMALAGAGWETVAFDVSPTAIEWCIEWFGDAVDWQVADLFDLPTTWHHAFDLVVEVRTVQSLPPAMRCEALDAVAGLVGGRLLLIASARPHHVIPTGPPWAVSEVELVALERGGLTKESLTVDGSGPGSRLVGTWVRS